MTNGSLEYGTLTGSNSQDEAMKRGLATAKEKQRA